MPSLNLLPKRRIILFIVKGLLVAIPVVFVVWLINYRFMLLTDVTQVYRPGNPRTDIAVRDRALIKTASTAPYDWIIDENAFAFRGTLPRATDAVRVRLDLAATKVPYLALTATGNSTNGEIKKIIHSSLLNALDWPTIRSDRLTLWQRPSVAATETTSAREIPRFASFDEFRAADVDSTRVGFVDLDEHSFVMPDKYEPRTEMQRLPNDLRGAMTILVFAANEDLTLNFAKTDMNYRTGRDPLTIRIRRTDMPADAPNRWLKTVTVRDDGITDRSRERGAEQDITVRFEDAPTGVYIVEFDCTDEVLIRRLRTPQQYLGFRDRVYLASGPVFTPDQGFSPLNVTTDARDLRLTTFHREGRQRVNVDGEVLDLMKPGLGATKTLEDEQTTFRVLRGDLVIEAKGLTTLAPFKLLAVGGRPINLAAKPNLDEFDYIVAPYIPNGEGVLQIDETFRTTDLNLKDGQVKFSLVAAGLRERQGTLGLQRLRLTYDRNPLPWDRIWTRVKKTVGGGT